MQTSIWHNPRCSKSRTTLKLLEDNGETPEVILYLENPPSKDELLNALSMLGKAPRDIMRKGEKIFAELGLKSGEQSDEQLVDAMLANPILIERPIVFKNSKAAIGRPPENVLELL